MNKDFGKYKLNLTLESPDCERKVKQKHEVFLSKDTDTYGNGCHLALRNTETGVTNYYDVRYEAWFHTDNIIQSIVTFAFMTWSGENGSWHIIDIRVGKA